MLVLGIEETRDNLTRLLTKVDHDCKPVLILEPDAAHSAVLMSKREYDALLKTLAVLTKEGAQVPAPDC
jgi:PHD/YefM family antitoxin component YafN of YafNO toxin-antitoxin module